MGESSEMAFQGTIGIVGGGSWGTALAHLVGGHGHAVCHWMRDAGTVQEVNQQHTNSRYLPGMALPLTVKATQDLREVAESCRLILVVVPSHSFRGVMRELGQWLDGGHMLVHATKGFEPGTFKRMSTLIQEETCVRQLGVLSGPNLAREVALGQPSATVLASRFPAVIEAARSVLVGKTFRVYVNTDVVGTEVGGALKNILAIASGIVTGLEFGENTKALLLTRGLVEMARLGVQMGAVPATFSGLSGIGDLMATCFSPLSRNHQVGLRLARGESLDQIVRSMNQVAEGIKTTQSVHAYALAQGVYMPITEGVYRILHEGTPPQEVLGQLMENSRFVFEHDPEFSLS
ncbi:MAG: NAD(P)H-dependent glycerol-3-phosphate dehydrogenase [Candidatus Sericytochromatia bacterium]|nr:NAD(P)H-dependent glycerol-3-phosphate dehydrogenase [Candidatus Sericytochromatia bacterium]